MSDITRSSRRLLPAVFLMFFAAAAESAQPVRPHLVLFVADDLTARDCGPYGAKDVRTPHLDALAVESLRFDRAYAGSPTCVPSRAVLYTGLMPFRNGAHANHSQCKPGLRSLAHYFGELGYQVAQAGKKHFGPAEVFPFERIEGSETPEPGFEAKPGLRMDLDVAALDRWLAQRQDQRPLLLIVADHSPHVVWPDRATYDPAAVEIPPDHIDTPDTRQARARYYTDVEKMDTNVGALVAALRRHGLWDATAFLFTSDQGAQWAFSKWTLYEAGIRVPLLVRWPGLTRTAAHTAAMVSLVDVLPTLHEALGVPVPAGLDGESFWPVIAGRRGSHRDRVFATHTGDRDWNRSPARSVRDERYKLIVNLAPEIVYTTHMDKATDHDGGREYWPSWEDAGRRDPLAAAVVKRYRHHPAEEFYDLATDPYERHNLAGDPAYATVRRELRAQLDAWRESQGDPVPPGATVLVPRGSREDGR